MILSAALLFASALSVSQTTGSIAGCIADATGQRLARAEIFATGESTRPTTSADASGCFELKALTPRRYRVTARLAGFNNSTRDNVAVAAGAATPLDMRMSISPICECVRFAGSLADHLKEADAILHLRIAAPTEAATSASIYYPHSAVVLHAIKTTPKAGNPITLLQGQISGSALPYEAGDEFVAFLRSVPDRGYTIINDNPESMVSLGSRKIAMVFVVRDGRIVDAPADFSRYAGTTLDSFMRELRKGI
jgi:hypothetical protein